MASKIKGVAKGALKVAGLFVGLYIVIGFIYWELWAAFDCNPKSLPVFLGNYVRNEDGKLVRYGEWEEKSDTIIIENINEK